MLSTILRDKPSFIPAADINCQGTIRDRLPVLSVVLSICTAVAVLFLAMPRR